MPHPQLDRSKLIFRPLEERKNRADIAADAVNPGACPRPLEGQEADILAETVVRIRAASARNAPVVLAFGAHTVKNGLAPVLIKLMESGWIRHLATNGAAIIHDWEFAYLGQTSEHVAQNVSRGLFGNWQETGFYVNLAINVGAYEGLGYGESVGKFIEEGRLKIPSAEELRQRIWAALERDPARAAAGADLLDIVTRFRLPPGVMRVPHRWKKFSLQAAAARLGVPLTGHPMIGHDIIYNHPMNHGAAIGRTALRDFLAFAQTISHIEHGVYLSVGSAVMSPMVFEKSLSMAQNLAAQQGRGIRNHHILVVDLVRSSWDWSCGEPPESDPAYYLRFNKSFSRMGGTMRYLTMDNRDFLLHLWQALGEQSGKESAIGYP